MFGPDMKFTPAERMVILENLESMKMSVSFALLKWTQDDLEGFVQSMSEHTASYEAIVQMFSNKYIKHLLEQNKGGN